MSKKTLALIAAFALLLCGCATLFKSSTTPVSMSTSPDGAQVYVNGTYMGVTPVQLTLTSKESYTIEFRKQGFASKTVFLPKSIGAGWVILDILGGLIPIIIDAATGNWYSLDQDRINASLDPLPGTVIQQNTAPQTYIIQNGQAIPVQTVPAAQQPVQQTAPIYVQPIEAAPAQ